MREVDDLGRRNAREEVLRAAREADDLVRKHRAADEDVVVFDHQPIERDRHVLLQASEAELLDDRRGDCPQRGERSGVIPPMVEDPAIPGAAVNDSPADQAS